MNFGTIAEAKFVLIEQEPDSVECFCQGVLQIPCCERPNKYLLWKCNDEDFQQVDRQLGDYIETSSCLCRTCCQTKRSFSAGLSIGGVSVGFAEQPYKCRSSNFWSCCCMKPEIRIYLNNNVIGKVVQPYYGPCWGPRNKICCPIMVLQVFNGADELIYSITGKCCQKSTWFILCQCCGCKEIKYEIRDAQNQFVGMIKNLYNGCLTECFTRQDKFGISFEGVTAPKDKVLLMNAAIWLDYLQYQA